MTIYNREDPRTVLPQLEKLINSADERIVSLDKRIVSLEQSCSHVGDYKYHTPSSVSCLSGRYFQVAYLTLDKGLWLVDMHCAFPNTNTTGVRETRCTTATSGYNDVTTAPPALGNITIDRIAGGSFGQYTQAHFPVNVSETTTYRLIAVQTSNLTMSVTGRMYAVRIK